MSFFSMDTSSLKILLQSNYLFQGLNDEQLSEVLLISNIAHIPKGEFVLREGEVDDKIYLLLEGEVEVLKNEEGTEVQTRLAILKAGELIGEMAFIHSAPRSASVRVLKNAQFLFFSVAKLSQMASQEKAFDQISKNISKKLTERLRKTNEVTVRALTEQLKVAKVQIISGQFLFHILIFFSAWVFLLSLLVKRILTESSNTFISALAVLIIAAICVYYVIRSPFSPEFFGLTLKRWKKNLFEAFLWSIPFLLIVTGMKWFAIRYTHIYETDSLFEFSFVHPGSALSPQLQIAFSIIYLIFVPLQELSVRGTIQSALKAVISGKHTTFSSIILSNLVFASVHAHYSPVFSLIAFLVGIFWGILYAHQKSIVGPILSHFLIGAYALVFLDLTKFFST